MSERVPHQSDDNEAPNERDILTSEQTQEDGASTEDAAEKQTPASPAQIAFERAMEQIPEGVDPVEYAKRVNAPYWKFIDWEFPEQDCAW